MNPHACRIVLRPRGPLEAIDLSFMLLREARVPVVGLAALTLLPAWGATMGLAWALGWSPLVALVPFVFGPLLQAPFTVLFGRFLFSAKVPLKEVWRGTTQGLFGVGMSWAITDFSLLFCFGIGLIAQPLLAFLPEVVLLERARFGRAIIRVTHLVASQPIGAALSVAARWGLPLWGMLAGEVLGQFLVSFLLQIGEPFGSLAGGQITPFALAGILAVQPLLAVYRLMVYVDARTRTEGWDLQVAIRAVRLGGQG